MRFKSTTPSLLRSSKKDAANASRMCNRHKRRLLGRRWGCRNIEELVRRGECMPKVEGMEDVTVREE